MIYYMRKKVFAIELIHVLIFFFQCICLTYILFAGITGTFNWILLVTVCSIILNGLILLLNKGVYPFTALAEKQGAEGSTVIGRILPDWIARNMFKIASILFFVGLVILAIRFFRE